MPAFGVVAAVQLDTGTFVVTTAAGQDVSVQLLPELAVDALHDATGTLVVLFAVQVVAT